MYNPFTLKDLNEKYPNVISLHIVQSNDSCQITNYIYCMLLYVRFHFQVGFKKFFQELFARTDVSILGEDGNLSDTYTVIVYEPNYFEQLDEALNSDSDFDNETIGMEMYTMI